MTNLHAAIEKTSEAMLAAALPQQGPPQGGGGPAMGGPPSQGQGPGGGPQMGMQAKQQQPPQSQMQPGKAQGGASQSLNLVKFSLPAGPIAEADLPKIKAAIEGACQELNQAIETAGKKVDNSTLQSGIMALQGWLKRQPCVSGVSSKYSIDTPDKYDEQIFYTYPGTLPFDINFKMAGANKYPYRLMLFVTRVDLFTPVSLVVNRSSDGIPVPQDWPKTPWSYWASQGKEEAL